MPNIPDKFGIWTVSLEDNHANEPSLSAWTNTREANASPSDFEIEIVRPVAHIAAENDDYPY